MHESCCTPEAVLSNLLEISIEADSSIVRACTRCRYEHLNERIHHCASGPAAHVSPLFLSGPVARVQEKQAVHCVKLKDLTREKIQLFLCWQEPPHATLPVRARAGAASPQARRIAASPTGSDGRAARRRMGLRTGSPAQRSPALTALLPVDTAAVSAPCNL